MVGNILLFSDDVKVLWYVKHPITSNKTELLEDLLKIKLWCDRNAMQLNVDKCQAMIW